MNKWTPLRKARRVSARVWRMGRLMRDGTVEPVSQIQILRRDRGQGEKKKNGSADHEQDWQSYPVDPPSA